MTEHQPASARTTMKRGTNRAVYSPAQIREVLEAGMIAHVGVNTDDGPIVLPMAYGLLDDHILIHGSVANAMLRGGRDIEVCVTVTIVDGLVVARSPLHNSMNYRSVVIRGIGVPVTDPTEHHDALKIINDHIAPIWDTARAPSDIDYKQTMVLAVSLTEASAKIRGGDPIDDAEDLEGPWWAGVVPLTHTWGVAIAAEDLKDGVAPPPSVTGLANINAHPLPEANS